MARYRGAGGFSGYCHVGDAIFGQELTGSFVLHEEVAEVEEVLSRLKQFVFLLFGDVILSFYFCDANINDDLYKWRFIL